MSAAATALGTLLVQRLDAMLGTTLSQQANLVSGARPDAVRQPAQADRGEPADNKVQRHPQENVNRVAGRVATHQTPLAHAGAGKSTVADATASALLKFGPTARLILDLLAQYPQRMPVQTATPLLDLPPAPTMDNRASPGQTQHQTVRPDAAAAANTAAVVDRVATLLRQALAGAVQDSGMFYEAHLAQLALGQRSAASLQAEPQAGAHAPAATRDHPAPSSPDVALSTQHLVRQQLEVLAHQTFVWQGQAWPGADMDWDIERHSPAKTFDDTADALEHWTSRLTLDLPVLGQVHAHLTLTGQQVVIDLHAPDAAPHLQQHADALRQRLSADGLNLNRLFITAQADDARDPHAAPAAPPR